MAKPRRELSPLAKEEKRKREREDERKMLYSSSREFFEIDLPLFGGACLLWLRERANVERRVKN